MKLLDIYLYLFIILFGNNLIQDSYLALIKPYWQIIITSYRLALQALYELVERFQCDKNPGFMTLFLEQCRVLSAHLCDTCASLA
jgi:hypothetical protein